MPMRQLPVLEVDGVKVNQSFAIARYLAKRSGLAGANDWESLQVDIAVDTLTDLRLSKRNYFCSWIHILKFICLSYFPRTSCILQRRR